MVVNNMTRPRRIREIDSMSALLRQNGNLNNAVIQGLDLTSLDWDKIEMKNTVFLGCIFPDHINPCLLAEAGAVIFPSLPDLPYNPYRGQLYTREELMEGWTPEEDKSVDLEIYNYFSDYGRKDVSVMQALAMRLHDHAIDDALSDLLEGRTEKDGEKKVIGIMGGHSTLRTDPYFEKVALLARKLTRDGYYIATGGGPGMMEAGNLGAYFAQYEEEDLRAAITSMQAAPSYKDAGYVQRAMDVVEKYPQGTSSLAIPTWFYGHEPSNLFSLQIAKYFSNSLREDGLLAVSMHGVIFSPGSAGTTQEVFMDATQNHYSTFEFISPMVFLGEKHFTTDTLIYDCLKKQAEGKKYEKYMLLTDEVEEVCNFIASHPPIK